MNNMGELHLGRGLLLFGLISALLGVAGYKACDYAMAHVDVDVRVK